MLRPFLMLAIALIALAALAAKPEDRQPARIGVAAERVALDPGDPARTRVGSLRYLGGWALTSGDPRFGGLSALSVAAGGFTAVTDTGLLVTFHRSGGRDGAARLAPLPAYPREGATKQDRDAESMALDPAADRMWIGFENSNSVFRYGGGLLEARAAPRGMAKWPKNGGAEALVRLPGGRFLVFSEEGRGPDNSNAALLFASDPAEKGARAVRFGYRPPAGYRVTDAALLPDGRLILLNRRFTLASGVSAALTVLDPKTIRPGHAVEGIEIARLQPPLTVDNMEALAVTIERGRTILWLASDDNFNVLQRTLLMKFALEGATAR